MRSEGPMPVAIKQRVRFGGVTAEELFETYVDARKHANAVASSAVISAKEGSAFSVFGPNGVRGRMLRVVPGRLVVQAWRSNQFKDEDADSIVTIAFTVTSAGGQLDLFHANLPERLRESTADGWREMYWNSWRRYLLRRRAR
jgi:uncharacterized protein YndB with AHSA1/START domain